MIPMSSNHQINKLQIIGYVLTMSLLQACSVTTRSPENAFFDVYKQIRGVEEEFAQFTFPSFEDLEKKNKTNFIHMFLSRINEPRGGHQSLLSQSTNSLHDYYLMAGGGADGGIACRELLMKALFQYGPVYSKYAFLLDETGPLVTDEEWVRWAQQCKQNGSALFNWRYDLKRKIPDIL